MAAAAKKNTLVFRSRTTMRSLLIMDRNDSHHKIPCHDCDKVRQGDIQDTLKDLVSHLCPWERCVKYDWDKRVARRSSLASHTLRRERKGLVSLQPSGCPHDQSDPHSSLIPSVVMHLLYLSAVWWNHFLRLQLGSCRPSLCKGGGARLQKYCGCKTYSSNFKQWMWTRLESIWILKINC